VSKPDDLANRCLNPAPNPVAVGNMVAAERLQRFLLLLEAECRIHRAERRQGRLKTPRLEKDREMRPLRTAPPAPSEHLRATGTPR
jgi:hypothetical protein